MGFRELIKEVQDYTGFSDEEAKEALECMVESVAVHLNEIGRKDFASQLPEELQEIALAAQPNPETVQQDLIEQFMESQEIEEPRAKQQILAAWQALKDAISHGEIEHIKAQLPRTTVSLLH